MSPEERHNLAARAVAREYSRRPGLETTTDRGAGAMGSPYEAANYSPRRGRIPGGAPADHKVDLPEFTRSELVKGSRYSRKNSGLYRELVDLMRLYAVGSGIKAQSQAENRPAAKEMEAAFREWGRIADITGRFTWTQVQRLVSACVDTDGEIYVHKTFHPVTGEPRLQLIESHRVGDFGKGDTWDGHKLNSYGQTTHYRVKMDSGAVKDIPSFNVLHIFDPEAPSSIRSAPPGSHALHHIQDESEMLALEKHGVKDNLDVARVLKTAKGTLDEEGDFSAVGLSEAGNSPSDPKQLQRIVGGKIVAIGTDETLESFESKRPSPTFTGFLEHIRREASLGLLPYSIAVDPGKVSSGAIRVDVSKAQRRFEARQTLLFEKLIAPVWFFVIGTKIDRKQLRATANWWKITAGTPRQFTVDAGRNEESNRRDVEKGLKTPGDSYTEAGDDFLEAMERKAQELQGLREIAERYNLTPEILFPLMAPPPAPGQGVAGTPPSAKPA